MLIQQTLEQGYKVEAYDYNPSKSDINHTNLTIVHSDLNNIMAIKQAAERADAVISLLGPTGKTKGCPISDGITNILNAIKEKSANRLIATTTPRATDPNDSFDIKFFLALMIIKLSMKDVYLDIVRTAEVIHKSGLNWIIVRLPLFNNEPKKGNVNVGYLGKGKIKLSLSRVDSAGFLLNQVNGTEFLYKAPAISN